jgi:hypothetical protein
VSHVVFVALLSFAMLWSWAEQSPSAPAEKLLVFPSNMALQTAADRQSFVAQLVQPDGVTRDVTEQVKRELADEALAYFDGTTLRPSSDGQTVVRIRYREQLIEVPISSSDSAFERPVSFKTDVMPILMMAGCNSGGCHGSARGQDGFRLSLFGYDPDGDYDRITRELPSRRINLARPERSLLLLKATGEVAHGGGDRFEVGSEHYSTILRWIQAGAPKDPPTIPTPVGLELMPDEIVLQGEGETQQMIARVKYSDGTDRDVTSLAVFLTSNDNSAEVSPGGLVTAKNRGEAFVTARFDTFTVGTPVIVIPEGLEYTWPDVPEHNYIDALVHEKLRKLRIAPSELCDDATFLRRVYIDIVGQLPTREQYEVFVSTEDPKKRERLVDELLGRKEFIELWVMKFAELLKIRSSTDNTGISYKASLLYYNWLQDRLVNNVPMNQIVKELIASTGGSFKNPSTNYFQVERDTLKLAENTAQVFAGMRLQCAQCHNHPFDQWTMEDYYGFASFFSQVGRKNGEDPRETIVFNRGGGEVNHPVTNKPVPPKFLGGDSPDVKGKDRRAVLAEWLASPENPYFARNLANMIWAHFFGRGIIEPVDDVRISNPPSNGELLDELALHFVEYDYDFKRLVRDICLSHTYQLSSRTNDTNAEDDRNFSRGAIRRIRAEVLLDCISQVTESHEKFRGLPQGARAVQIADGRTTNFFLTTFGRATRETVCSSEVKMEPNLSQALHLINGSTVQRNIERGQVVKKLLAKTLTPEQVIEELYIRCLTRKPKDEEMTALMTAVEADGTSAEAVLNDIFWALLNSKEFIFTH